MQGHTLQERHLTEADFHDHKVGFGQELIWYRKGALDAVHEYAFSLLGPLTGRTLVEIGCGQGDHALRFARQGARVYASDISEEMIRSAQEHARTANLQTQVQFEQMAAESLRYPADFADCVFGGAILHHTDLAQTRQEVYRVLKPGGRAVFIEPLGHNPIINLFRRLTPHRRTPTETPLRLKDIADWGTSFRTCRHREFYLLALAALVVLPLDSKLLFQAVVRPLLFLDRAILTGCPAAGRYAWVTVLQVDK